MQSKKVGFTSGLGFIMAAAGSAIGLGNLWGFPYKTAKNGGAAFVLIYVACVLFIGFITMLTEIYIGRRAQANPVTAFKSIHKNIGWMGLVAVIVPALITCYYSVLGGWTLKFTLHSFSGNAGIIESFSTNTFEVIAFTALFVFLALIVIAAGVQSGIERMSKVLMPVCALFSCLAVGWIIRPQRALNDLRDYGTRVPGWLAPVYAVFVKFVTPALILVIEIGGVRNEFGRGNGAVVYAAFFLLLLAVALYFALFRNSYTGTNADEKIAK